MSFLRARASYLIWSGLLLLFGLVGLGAFLAVHSVQTTRTWVTQSHEVINSTKDLLADALDAETSQRGYLITGNRAHLLPYEQATERITVTLSKLRQLTSDNPDQLHNLDQVAGSIQRKMQELARPIELRTSLGIAAANAVMEMDIDRNIMGEIRAGLSAITREEERLFQDRLAEMDRSQGIAHTSIATGAILAFGLIGFGGWSLRAANALRRRAEASVAATAAELSTAFNSLSQGVAVFDAAWRLIRWNSGWATLLGMPFDNMHIGIDYSNLARMVEPGFLEAEEQVSRTSMQAGPVIFERTRPDGQVFELRRTTLPGGGFVLTCANITVRTRMAQAIQEAERMQAIGHLTGAVAHDFNNYLTIIIGNLDFAQRKNSDPDVGARIAAAIQGAQRSAELTRQLLAIGRRQPLEPVAADLNKLAREYSGLLRRSLPESIDINVVECAGLWPATVDPARLENAILNLALNARDAMREGGKLTLETANVTLDEHYAAEDVGIRPGPYVSIAISDTGTGMSSEVLAHCLEPFFTTKGEEGTGLGLSSVYGFVKQSKGHIKIYSESGHGTTICLYFPQAECFRDLHVPTI